MPLQYGDLMSVVGEAKRRWAEAGADQQTLDFATVRIGELPDTIVG